MCRGSSVRCDARQPQEPDYGRGGERGFTNSARRVKAAVWGRVCEGWKCLGGNTVGSMNAREKAGNGMA